MNDMLRQLDQSAAQKQRSELEDDAELPRTHWLKKAAIPILAVLFILYFLGFEKNLLGVFTKQKTAIEIPKPLSMNEKWLTAEPTARGSSNSAIAITESITIAEVIMPEANVVEKNLSAPAVASSAPALSAAEVPAQESNELAEPLIPNLLAQASLAFAQNQLMTPAQNSAVQLYQRVLMLDPMNPQALQGMQKIQEKYLQFYRHALARGDQAEAGVYRLRALKLGADLGGEAEMSDSVVQPIPQQALPNPTKGDSIRLTSATLDRHLRDQLQSIDVDEAAKKILETLHRGQVLPLAIQALAERYLQHGLLAELMALQQQVAPLNRMLGDYLAAKIALLQGRDDEAIQLLTAITLEGDGEQNRLRLLGGLYQKQHAYESALVTYQRLLSLARSNSNDWLGLAVAFEGLKRYQSAAQAYQNVINLSHPDNRILAFCRQRIKELSIYQLQR